MKAVVTRVRSASVTIGGRVNGAIGEGLLILLGITLVYLRTLFKEDEL